MMTDAIMMKSFFVKSPLLNAVFKKYAIKKKDKPFVTTSALRDELIDNDMGNSARKTNSHFLKGMFLMAKYTISTQNNNEISREA